MIVTLTAYKRPAYLRRCLASLAVAMHELQKADEEPMLLLVDVDEPPSRDLLTEIRHEIAHVDAPDELFCEISTTFHAQHRGCQGNTYLNLEQGWDAAEKFGDDFVVHIEDDALISRDGLRYMAWARDAYRDDPDIFSVTTYRMDTDPDSYYAVDEVARRPWFTCLGAWGTWHDRWMDIRRDWSHDTKDWAWRMVFGARGAEKGTGIINGRREVYPILSRAQNIGAKDSTFVPSAAWHAQHHETKVWAGADDVVLPAVSEWREVEHAPRA